MNSNDRQVGHIPRAVASKLAPYMDAKLITVEGRMVSQNLDHKQHYKLAIDISIYARASHRAVLEPELAWMTPGQRGFDSLRGVGASGPAGSQGGDTGTSGAGGSGVGLPGRDWNEEEMKRLMENLRKVEDDERQANGVMVRQAMLHVPCCLDPSRHINITHHQDALTSNIDVSKLPMHAAPPGLGNKQLFVDLLPHQSQALQVGSSIESV